MTLSLREVVETEIRRIRRQHLLEATREAPSTWELHEDALHWYVILRNVDEPDIDLEVLDDVIIVRAAVGATLRESVLPIPGPCRAGRPAFRFRAGTLQVRLKVQAP